jgi:hypothetical protein
MNLLWEPVERSGKYAGGAQVRSSWGFYYGGNQPSATEPMSGSDAVHVHGEGWAKGAPHVVRRSGVGRAWIRSVAEVSGWLGGLDGGLAGLSTASFWEMIAFLSYSSLIALFYCYMLNFASFFTYNTLSLFNFVSSNSLTYDAKSSWFFYEFKFKLKNNIWPPFLSVFLFDSIFSKQYKTPTLFFILCVNILISLFPPFYNLMA